MNFPKQVLKADIDPAWLLRIFTIIPVVLILLAGGCAIWIYFFALSLLPQSQSLVETPGLSAEVQVVRDENGIPGIIGQNQQDVAQVFGYVMAQDRLWQMDYLRRAGQGRLAEILGRDFLARDQLMRAMSLDCGNLYEKEKLGDREREWLDKFVLGINQYIAAHADKRPLEFSLLDYHPRRVTTEDLMSIILALAWESSPATKVDPVLIQLLGRLGKERGLDLFPSDPAASSPLIVSGLAGWSPQGLLFSLPSREEDFAGCPGFQGGCEWAVGPGSTRSGKPMIACSAYQVLCAPGFWYRARLVAGDMRLSGSFIPGVPVALAGTNGHVGWGSISTPIDDADLYVERLDCDQGNIFWRVDRPKRMRLANEVFRVRGRSPVTRTIRLTDHGPIVSDVRNSRALSLRWTAARGLGLVQSFFALNRASDGRSLRASLTMLKSPCLSVVWADEKGHCGVQTAGLAPVRPRGSDGIVPMPAWTGVHEWVGFVPFEDLPSVTDPDSGIAVVSDGRPGGANYPFFLSCYWSADSRADRVRRLLGQTHEHYRESFQRILSDTVSPLAQELTPVIVHAMEPEASPRGAESAALGLLSSWDHDMKGGSPGAAVFGLTYCSLVNDLLLAQLGEQMYDRFTAYRPMVSRLVFKVFVQKRSTWITDKRAQAMLRVSFKKAVALGTKLMGRNPKKWQWGKILRAELRHPLTERSRFLEVLYDVGPISYRGSGDTVDYSGWSMSHPFRLLEGVSLKQIADMTEPPQVSEISPLGVSGHFFSPHYKDQTREWLQGRLLRDTFAAGDIQKRGSSTVVFRPIHQPVVSMSQQP
jgi:penicillin amidase